MALPMVVTQCSMALMQFADAWMIKGLGDEALAALAAITPAGMLILAVSTFGTGFLACIATFVGQGHGRNDRICCVITARNGILFAVGLGVAALAFIPTAPFAFGVFGHAIEVYELEVAYFQVSLLAILPQLVATAIGYYFIGIHAPRITAVGSVLATLLNLLFNYGFIFGRLGLPELGFVGTAWGTVAASICYCAFMAWAFLRSTRAVCRRPGENYYREMGRIGLPTGLQDAIDVVSWGLIVVYLVGQFGTQHLAAATILIRCMQLSFLPADGVGTALMALVARSIGAGSLLRARLEARTGRIVVGTYMVSMAVLFYLFRYQIMRLFTNDPEVVRIGAQAMTCVSLFQIFDALNIVYVHCLTAAGDTLWTSLVNLTLCGVLLFGGGYFLTHAYPELGSLGVWIAATLFIAVQGTAFMLRWNRQKWAEIVLLRRFHSPETPAPRN